MLNSMCFLVSYLAWIGIITDAPIELVVMSTGGRLL
jgi:hypothetical protein